jgi:hypothetical protein
MEETSHNLCAAKEYFSRKLAHSLPNHPRDASFAPSGMPAALPVGAPRKFERSPAMIVLIITTVTKI